MTAPTMPSNLQSIVDGMRLDLARGLGGSWSIEHPEIHRPIKMVVTPDGVSWLVRVACGDRFVFDSAVEPQAFLSSLHSFVVYVIRTLTAKAPPEN
jgi:hypothetical protein